jgi:hypothetical protein
VRNGIKMLEKSLFSDIKDRTYYEDMRFIAVLKGKFDEIDLNNRPIKENLIYAELSMRWKYHYNCNIHSVIDFSLLIANQISYIDRTL